MKITATREQFIREFESSSYKDNFTREALNALYDYMIKLEKATGREIVVDIVGIAYTYSQTADEEEIERARDEGAVIAEFSDGSVLVYNF